MAATSAEPASADAADAGRECELGAAEAGREWALACEFGRECEPVVLRVVVAAAPLAEAVGELGVSEAGVVSAVGSIGARLKAVAARRAAAARALASVNVERARRWWDCWCPPALPTSSTCACIWA